MAFRVIFIWAVRGPLQADPRAWLVFQEVPEVGDRLVSQQKQGLGWR